MSVLVDTSVWSLLLRRNRPSDDEACRKLESLLKQGQPVVLLGVILQEVLQGVRDEAALDRLKSSLEAFPLLELRREDYLYAAELHNACRTKGVQASTIDFQIAAACVNHDSLLLTADQDFANIARHCPLQLL